MNGLHVCKPGNAPQIGQIKTFTINGDRIKSTPADKGGQPYMILKVVQSETYKDQYGNLGFNLVIDPAGAQESTAPRTQAQPARQNGGGGAMSKDDYWTRKEQRDIEREQREIERAPRIERQHSQEMAIRYFALRGIELPSGAEGTKMFRDMIDWFQRDIGHEPIVPSKLPEPEYSPPDGENYADQEPPF